MASSARPVTMVRLSGEPFPCFPLPEGFAISWYRPGDESWWLDIQQRADPQARISSELFWRYFGGAPQELPRRQCFLLEAGGAPVGTATAWFDPSYHGQSWGRLHWVALVPECQSRGLAKPLLSVACARLRQLHPHRSFLRTDAARLPAIGLYLKFGFEPEMRSAEDQALWRQILLNLGAKAP